MLLPIIFIAAGAVFLTVFLVLRVKKGACAPVTVIKSWTSMCFIGAALSAILTKGFTGENAVFGGLVLAGLTFGLLGDIWLDQKLAHPENDKVYTYAGFISFCVGHAFYVVAMVNRFYVPGNVKRIISPLAIAIAIAAFVPFGEKLLRVKYGSYKAICSVYTLFLAGFALFAGSMARIYDHGSITLNMLLAGALLFVISDAILNNTYFGTGKKMPLDVIPNHITYYAAQFVVALSLCFIDR